ncbi:MAG: hypothetical protein WCE57_13280 [Salegentibacter sp.]
MNDKIRSHSNYNLIFLKVVIVAPFSFGYIDSLVRKMSENNDLEVLFINTSEISFQYSGIIHRTKNFFLKTFAKKNLKRDFVEDIIEQQVRERGPQDKILVIRPDKFSKQHLKFLKSHSKTLIAYLFDSVAVIPGQVKNKAIFDEVFSYEKEDVQKYGFKFITNFIPFDLPSNPMTPNNGLFNISSFDHRYKLLLKIAKQLKEANYDYHIVVKKDKPLSEELVHFTSEYWSLEKVKESLKEASILLDIQKHEQFGLSFRVFESLGFSKKLITTNSSIVEYDFYDSDNILVIDPANPVIPREFFQKEYKELPESIISKYRREAWIEQVLF